MPSRAAFPLKTFSHRELFSMSLYVVRLGCTIPAGFEQVRYNENISGASYIALISAIRLADTDRDWYDWMVGDELARALGVMGFESDEAFEAFCDENAEYNVAIADLNKQFCPPRRKAKKRTPRASNANAAPRPPRYYPAPLFEWLYKSFSPMDSIDNPKIGVKPPDRDNETAEERERRMDEYTSWWEGESARIDATCLDVAGVGREQVSEGCLGFVNRFGTTGMETAGLIYQLKALGASCDEILSALDALNPFLPVNAGREAVESWHRFDWFEYEDDMPGGGSTYQRLKGCSSYLFVGLAKQVACITDKDKALAYLYEEAESAVLLRAMYEMTLAVYAFEYATEPTRWFCPANDSTGRHRHNTASELERLLFDENGNAFREAFEGTREFCLEALEGGYCSIWTLAENSDLLELWDDTWRSGVDIEDIVNGFEHGRIASR